MPLGQARAVAMITVRDRAAAEHFYGETLGLARLPGDGFAAVFDIGGTQLRVTEVPTFTASAHPVLGFEVDDIAAAARALAARGAAMTIYDGLGQDADGVWTAPDGSCKVAFFSDPDGNALSLTQTL